MSTYTYDKILSKAKECKNSVEKDYKLGVNSPWAYYFAKAITKPHTPIKKIEFDKAPTPTGTHISNQIYQKDYTQVAKYLTDFVEKRGRLPNYIQWNSYHIRVRDYCYMLARILVYYNEHKALPKYANINTKCWTRPTETGNEVYDYAVKKYGKKFTSLDDILEYVANHFTYEFYYDDYKSNKQVTDTKAGNCTDLLQWLCNMVEPLGYEWKCVHVSCRSSGTGHVWGKFKHPKNTGGEWVNRDIACCADNGSVRCVWCEDGYLNAYNPSWWLANLRR